MRLWYLSHCRQQRIWKVYTDTHSFLDTVMSSITKIKCAGSFDLFFARQILIYLTYSKRKGLKDVFYINDHVRKWHAKIK